MPFPISARLSERRTLLPDGVLRQHDVRPRRQRRQPKQLRVILRRLPESTRNGSDRWGRDKQVFIFILSFNYDLMTI